MVQINNDAAPAVLQHLRPISTDSLSFVCEAASLSVGDEQGLYTGTVAE